MRILISRTTLTGKLRILICHLMTRRELSIVSLLPPRQVCPMAAGYGLKPGA